MAADASDLQQDAPVHQKDGPAHGEDTERLLIELLDYTWDDIASLQEDGVIL